MAGTDMLLGQHLAGAIIQYFIVSWLSGVIEKLVKLNIQS
jgi:hypothetical protein